MLSVVSIKTPAQKHDPDIIDYSINADFDNPGKSLKINLQMTIGILQDNTVDLMLSHLAKINSVQVHDENEDRKIPVKFFSMDSIRLTIPSTIDLSGKLTLLFDYDLPVDSVSGSKSGM